MGGGEGEYRYCAWCSGDAEGEASDVRADGCRLGAIGTWCCTGALQTQNVSAKMDGERRGERKKSSEQGEIEEREWSSAQGRTEIRAYGVVGREEGIRRRRIALPARGPHFRRRRTR